jgi:hypothetical protein
MRLAAVPTLAAALACSACGLFLDDLSKGADGGNSGSDSDTDTDVAGNACEGVDLQELPCCNLDNTCGWNDDGTCDCPTCPWDAADCPLLTPCDGVDLVEFPCCNVENSCAYDNDLFCDCPTCVWDDSDCYPGDGGAPDAGQDTESGA